VVHDGTPHTPPDCTEATPVSGAVKALLRIRHYAAHVITFASRDAQGLGLGLGLGQK
jgi:hypothetical protein